MWAGFTIRMPKALVNTSPTIVQTTKSFIFVPLIFFSLIALFSVSPYRCSLISSLVLCALAPFRYLM
jgi:ACR3 family arsenite efflux pump ArsB